MRGRSALTLVEAVIDGVTPYLPVDVRAVRAGLGVLDSLLVWAVPSDVADPNSYGFLDIGDGRAGFRGPAMPFGVGTWLPFVPPTLRRRLAAADALDTVRDAVQQIVTPWPAPNTEAKSRTDAHDVMVWFEDPSGRRQFPEIRIRDT